MESNMKIIAVTNLLAGACRGAGGIPSSQELELAILTVERIEKRLAVEVPLSNKPAARKG